LLTAATTANFPKKIAAPLVVARQHQHPTQPQARLQSRIRDTLEDLGVKLQRQDDVYGWLLDQVAASLCTKKTFYATT
jgi:hypothetical protein